MHTVDYYFSLNSPWSYLGHARLLAIVARHGATLRLHPVNFGGVIFPATGGLPVPQRPPARQAYRLMELKRWPAYLGVPLNLDPDYWPADERFAAGAVIEARERGENAAGLAGALMRAVWAENRNIADRDTVQSLAMEHGISNEGLAEAAERQEGAWIAGSEQAIERGIFGAPSYLLGEELFWGQDRLDFLDRALAAAR